MQYHNFVDTYVGIRRNMKLEKWQIISDVLMSILVFSLVVETGDNAAIGMIVIGVINTVQFCDVFAAWRQYRQEQKQQTEQTKFQD